MVKCKFCGQKIPDHSIFCNYCGERQIKKQKEKAEVSIPEPRKISNTTWRIELRKENWSYIGKSAEECRTAARAYRRGWIEESGKKRFPTLEKAITEYIDTSEAVLSPSTICAYRSVLGSRFPDYMKQPINKIDWQKMVSDDAKSVSAKTVRNSWSLVKSSVEYISKRDNLGIKLPAVNLPQVVRNERDFLTWQMIPKFIDALEGEPCEIPALLALHSLRFSEVKGLTWENIDIQKKMIHVSGSMVYDSTHALTYKKTNKNQSSQRDVPIMIPQLIDALEDVSEDERTGFIVKAPEVSVYKQINRICENLGYPQVGIHGLRHSFASLCYHLQIPEKIAMQLGGWSDSTTLNRVYTHLAKVDIQAQTKELQEYFSKGITQEITQKAQKTA